MATKKTTTTIDTEFNTEVQKVYLEWFITEPDMFALCRNIVKDEYFDGDLRPAARFILEYSDQNSKLPIPEQIKAKTGISLNKLPDDLKGHSNWLIKEIERFCRTKALELVIFDGIELINDNRSGELEKRVRDAMTISLMSDLGANYFQEDAFARLEKMKDRSGFVSTGWKTLDDKLYGGFTRGGLNVFCGGSGSGKSLFLQNLAINWATAGLNVVYFSLELAQNLVEFRLDAMLTGKSTKEVIRDIPEVAAVIREVGKTAGTLIIKKLPEGGTTVNDLRAFLKECEIKTGIRFDAIIVDYLDLMYPTSIKIDPGNLFVKDKYTSEELRALMYEYDAFGATASQLNRGSVQSEEFDHSHIAGGISKINTADNVFGIYAPDHLKEKGKVELQFLKTRTSGAVGSKIELSYDPDTMKISDMLGFGPQTVNQLRQKVNAAPVPAVPAATPNGVGNLINKLKKTP
jgi:RecA/RadA recombinase